MNTRTGNAAFGELKDFQRDTANYVLRRLYDDDNASDRFLVADEVGLGKTLVARSVIEGAIDRLQRNEAVKRIDIVYICSNADIARQNISKLDVVGSGAKPLSTRITMLATQFKDLNRSVPDSSNRSNRRKTVNLIALTPGTSFNKGNQGGRVEERALLKWLLKPLFEEETRAQRNALDRILRMEVNEDNWFLKCSQFDSEDAAPDSTVTKKFRSSIRRKQVFKDLRNLIDDLYGRTQLDEAQKKRRRAIVSSLRQELAKVSLDCLEPNLVILDEFQNFTHLLHSPGSDSEKEVSELANLLFAFPQVKVLLLSATPYKAFTLREERDFGGDDHYHNFIKTVEFLKHQGGDGSTDDLKHALSEFRRLVETADDPKGAKEHIEATLRKVMCRTERPVSGASDMLLERREQTAPPTTKDLLAYVSLKKIGDEVGAGVNIEYWKSAPYFLNFMSGYKLHEKFLEHKFEASKRTELLANAQVIRTLTSRKKEGIDLGNARLRQLANETVEKGYWKLLWLPPSLPYHQATGPYAGVDPTAATKHLIFSSWAAAPTAIASLLSWTATHRIQTSNRKPRPKSSGSRLKYEIKNSLPSNMNELALFVPIPGLAKVMDPLEHARKTPNDLPTADQEIEYGVAQIEALVASKRPARPSLSRETWVWTAAFGFENADGALKYAELGDLIQEHKPSGATENYRGLPRHLVEADRASQNQVDLGAQPSYLRWLALIGLVGPANVAWRALHRATRGVPKITEQGISNAATVIGAGFRSLFNKPDVVSLLDGQNSKLSYWKVVLEYCLSGNLQAVMDEYIHHLIGNENLTTDEELLELAKGVRATISLRSSSLQAFNPRKPDKPLRFEAGFAQRYGSAKGIAKTDDASIDRMAHVRAAFNSPFWPMVLASTSVGQEGIDFHWWCHSIVHWNLPSNPVDFEQREGRVHRFKGHAVRKNVAAAHRAEALSSDTPDPWTAAFLAAEEAREAGANDLWPWWTYPGDSKIERWIPSFPLSKDQDREDLLKKQLVLYRLAFGQSRQEDLLSILQQQGYADDPDRTAELRIDLRPPKAVPKERQANKGAVV